MPNCRTTALLSSLLPTSSTSNCVWQAVAPQDEWPRNGRHGDAHVLLAAFSDSRRVNFRPIFLPSVNVNLNGQVDHSDFRRALPVLSTVLRAGHQALLSTFVKL